MLTYYLEENHLRICGPRIIMVHLTASLTGEQAFTSIPKPVTQG